MDVISAQVAFACGFKQSGGSGYPCHWCGKVTKLRDAEDFHVCSTHQLEYIEIGYDAMKAKYPLAGEDERNPDFFRKLSDRYIARAKALTKDELQLLVQRACSYEKECAQAILDGKTIDEFEASDIEVLGIAAEQHIDEY